MTVHLMNGLQMKIENWEFDDRRFDVCINSLDVGDELVWFERDIRFGNLKVRKTLRRLLDAVTFLVEDENQKVLTVGTIQL